MNQGFEALSVAVGTVLISFLPDGAPTSLCQPETPKRCTLGKNLRLCSSEEGGTIGGGGRCSCEVKRFNFIFCTMVLSACSSHQREDDTLASVLKLYSSITKYISVTNDCIDLYIFFLKEERFLPPVIRLSSVASSDPSIMS